MTQRTIVIYHANCIDGFTAAWVAWRRYRESAEYLPASYGDAPPDVTDAEVLIVDFSYPRAVLETMAEASHSLEVFDHHKTAQADLAGFDYATFDMERSGAGLAWDALFVTPRPWLVDYVEDRDLWRFKLPNSKSVNAFVSAHKRNSFQAWDALSSQRVELCADRGAAIGMFVDRYVEEMCAQAALVEIVGAEVPIVNAPYINISELLNKLAESAPFAVGWFQGKDGRYVYSLRSCGDVDVSAIAKGYGGGGHTRAAGFSSTDPPWVLWARTPGSP